MHTINVEASLLGERGNTTFCGRVLSGVMMGRRLLMMMMDDREMNDGR